MLDFFRLGASAQKLARNRDGNFGIATAICLPLLLGAGGMAIDVANAVMLRSQLQHADDAAALATASALADGTIKRDGATKFGQNFFAGQMANFISDPIALAEIKASTVVTVDPPAAGAELTYAVSVNSSYGMRVTAIMAVLGWDRVKIAAASKTISRSPNAPTTGQDALALYFVLDRSGSMGDLVDQINPVQPKLKVPGGTQFKFFCRDDNIETCDAKMSQDIIIDNYLDRISSVKIAAGILMSQLEIRDPKGKYIRTGAISYSGKADKQSDLAAGTSAATTYIQAMVADGATDSSGAFATALAALIAAKEPKKAIVFLTDGANNTAQSNDDTKASCDKARTAGITVYTIAAFAPPAGIKLLAYCATSVQTTFETRTFKGLTLAFETIGKIASGTVSSTRVTY